MASAVQITGVKELVKNFELTARDARNFARGATHKVAATVTKRAKANAPTDSRRMRKAIKSKRRRARGDMFRSDTIVASGDSRTDEKGAFYWFWVEFGTRFQAAAPFIGPAIDQTRPEAFKIFRADVLRRAIKAAEKRAKA